MQTSDLEPQILANGKGVAFSLARQNNPVQCVISVAALEAYFWLEPRAKEQQILRTFRNGYARIRAVAERKLLTRAVAHLELKAEDFAPPHA